MPNNSEDYSFIKQKIDSIKSQYQFLRNKSDDYAFSAVCIKNSIYKNPSLNLTEDDLKSSIVDGHADGGADILLLDPNNTEASDLIIGQAKYHANISSEEMKQALDKMIDFYLDLRNSIHGNIREDVIRRFATLNAEVGDESKIRFYIFTSAPKNSIRISTLQRKLQDRLNDDDKYELEVLFGDDIVSEIKEAESRRPSVEEGKLLIDETNNVLYYDYDSELDEAKAVVVNISAKSLKKLYEIHQTNLLSKNLRYFIKGKSDVNTDVRDTINNSPETFWYKNNGITIVCDYFKIDSKELKLKNFSIVNGGQTSTLIFKSPLNDFMDDFYIVCKVIRSQGDTEDNRNQFVLDIAKATNSQKPIKQSDLKANSPEQVRFATTIKEFGVHYKTKRGEEIPRNYRLDYKNTDISEVGKLSLSGIFQLPATSRNKPSHCYLPRYYTPTFGGSQEKVAKLIRDLLYIDFFFRKSFLYKYDRDHADRPSTITFAHNARTICLSYVALGSRIMQGNLQAFGQLIGNSRATGFYDDMFYPALKNLDGFNHIIRPDVFDGDKDELDKHLYALFDRIIREGYKSFDAAKRNDQALNETNFLKNDSNYFQILNSSWDDLSEEIDRNSMIF